MDIRQYNLKHLRDNLSLVGQEPVLFNLSIKDNIAYGLENVAEQSIQKAAILANIHSFVESLPQVSFKFKGVDPANFRDMIL